MHLITNNFKIKSKNKGVIYTYKVDFIEKQGGEGGGGSGGFQNEKTQIQISRNEPEEYKGRGDSL